MTRLVDDDGKEIVEHGVEAYYSGGAGEPYYQPTLNCLCGFSSGRCESWQEAGEAMDEHVREINSVDH